VEKIVYKDVEVPVEKILVKDKIVEVPIEVEHLVDKAVIKDVIREIPVERVVVRDREVPVETFKENIKYQVNLPIPSPSPAPPRWCDWFSMPEQ
jgi:hypothetical protein